MLIDETQSRSSLLYARVRRELQLVVESGPVPTLRARNPCGRCGFVPILTQMRIGCKLLDRIGRYRDYIIGAVTQCVLHSSWRNSRRFLIICRHGVFSRSFARRQFIYKLSTSHHITRRRARRRLKSGKSFRSCSGCPREGHRSPRISALRGCRC